MIEEYKKELKALRIKMEEAEKHAEKLPMFAEVILKEKLTGYEDWQEYCYGYKKVNTYDGVNRGYYKTGTRRTITNYKGPDYDCYLFNIYINSYTEYDSERDHGLDDICNKVPVVFYDEMNSTFYCTDEQIYGLLEALNEWKINACKEEKKLYKKERVEELKTLIKESEEELEDMGGTI